MTNIVNRVLAWLSPAHVASLAASGHILEADAIGLVAQVAKALETAVVATKGVAEKTTIGALIVADINAVANQHLTNVEKFAQVVENTLPVVIEIAATGGVPLAKNDVLSLVNALVQNVYTAEVSTTAGATAARLAPLLGIKLPAHA